MIRSFKDLPLSAPMLDAVGRAGYEIPTPIQARAIGIALEGRDLIGCAQTGTGKTAAFAIPTIERLCASRPGAGARALVLAPTRELALQIAETFAMLGGARGIRTVTLIGGESMGPQARGSGAASRRDRGHARPTLRLPRAPQRDAERACGSSCSTRPTGCSTWASRRKSSGCSSSLPSTGRRCASRRRCRPRSTVSCASICRDPSAWRSAAWPSPWRP